MQRGEHLKDREDILGTMVLVSNSILGPVSTPAFGLLEILL